MIKNINEINKFKNYNIKVEIKGDALNKTQLLIYFDNDLVYASTTGVFKLKNLEFFDIQREGFFFKYYPKIQTRLVWKAEKNKSSYLRWCTNFRVCRDIQCEVDKARVSYAAKYI